MSVFELSKHDIETIRESNDPSRLLARQYGVTIAVIQHVRSRPKDHRTLYKPIYVKPRQTLHVHTGHVDRRKRKPERKPAEPKPKRKPKPKRSPNAFIGPMMSGSMEECVPPEARCGRPMVTR